MRKYLIVDPFGLASGHHVNYNQFLADSLGDEVELTFWASQELCLAITGKVNKQPFFKRYFKKGLLLRLCLTLSLATRSVEQYDTVFFSSCEELSLAFWRPKSLSKCSILLTNNLPRMNAARRYLLRRIFRHIKNVLVHNDYQKKYLADEFGIGEKVLTIPHYSIGYERDAGKRHIASRGEIIFLGGSRGDKLLGEFIDLIEADIDNKYSYGIYGKVELTPEQEKILDRENVSLKNEYLDKMEYFEILKRAMFVVLFYKKSFNLKISGIFFDAISTITPMICSDIESFSCYFKKYGDLGIVIDNEQLNWQRRFLEKDFAEQYGRYISNITRMKKQCGHDVLKTIYLGL